MQPLISASILSADFTILGEEVAKVISAGADLIHIDVMDNHYVPNLTIGPGVCEAIHRRFPKVPLDVHLMVKPVDSLIPAFAKAGASYITVHPETTEHLDRTLSLIKKHEVKVGLALNPSTPLNVLDYILEKLDMILIMSVNPGFGGQSFIPSMLDKIKQTKTRIQSKSFPIRLEVDGGITIDNISALAKAGADIFVSGSTIFHSKDYAKVISMMKSEIKN